MRRISLRTLGVAAVLLAGCAPEATPRPITGVTIPIKDTVPGSYRPPRRAPPPSGPERPYRFPRVSWAELPNGLKVATIPGQALPIVQIRVAILAGSAADGEKPGLAAIAADMLQVGGSGAMSSHALSTRIASLGGDLSISAGFDSTVLRLAVTRDHLDEALDLLGAVVQRPQFSGVELDKLKKREADRLADLARTRGSWGTSMVLFRDLFTLPSEHHPYASWSPTPDEVKRITAFDLRAYHRRFFVPRNTFVVVAGDTTREAVKAAVQRAFGGAQGGDPPMISFADPLPEGGRKITVVDRPRSSQSDIVVGFLGPERGDKEWASFQVMNQILGGGVSGRLFADVREKQSLAYRTQSQVTALAHGPSVFTASAGTQTARTGVALKALLDNLDRLAVTAPDDAEVSTATSFLGGVLAINLETMGAVADQLVELRTMGLPDDYLDAYRRELATITPALASKAAGDRIHPGREVIVVAGDAAVIGPMLSRFGAVKVVDPTRDFARIRTIPMDRDAPLEVPRQAGK